MHLVLRLRGGMQIFVKTLTGRTIAVEIDKNEKVADLKNKIMNREGIPGD